MNVSDIEVNDVLEFGSGYHNSYHLLCISKQPYDDEKCTVQFIVWDGSLLKLQMYYELPLLRYELRLI